MATTLAELDAMRRAIALSAFGLGTASPNPPVGCVILDAEGRVVGEGYHERKGQAHAEAIALTNAGPKANGGTAVVTLEPCNHRGRTPPCHQALLDGGVTRVVIALLDPTSRDEGGAAKLRAAGIDVDTGLLASEARLVLGPWLTALVTRRPALHLVYACDQHGYRDVEVVPEFAFLRTSSDAVIGIHGQLEEGIPGVHAPDVFSLRATAMVEAPTESLTDLYKRGVRSLLLSGRSELSDLLVAQGMVDRATVYLARQVEPAVYGPGAASPDALVLGGLHLESVAKLDQYARLTFVNDEAPNP